MDEDASLTTVTPPDALYGGVVKVRRGRKRRTGGMPGRGERVKKPALTKTQADERDEAARKAAAAATPTGQRKAEAEAAEAAVRAAARTEYIGVLAPLMSVAGDQTKIFKLPEGSYTETFKNKLKEWRKGFNYMFKTFAVENKGKGLNIENWYKYRAAQNNLIDAIAKIAVFQNNKVVSKCEGQDPEIARLNVLDEYFDIVNEELFGHAIAAEDDPAPGMAGGGYDDDDDDEEDDPMVGGMDAPAAAAAAARAPSSTAVSLGLISADAQAAAQAAVGGGLGGAVAAVQAADAEAPGGAAAAPAAAGAGAAPARRRGSVVGILRQAAGVFTDTAGAVASSGSAALESVEDRIVSMRRGIREDPGATTAVVGGVLGSAVGASLLGSGASAAIVSAGVGALGYFGGFFNPWAVVAGAGQTLAAAAPALPTIGFIAGGAVITHAALRAVRSAAGFAGFCAARAVPEGVARANAATDALFDDAAVRFADAYDRSDARAIAAGGARAISSAAFRGAAAVSAAAHRAGAARRRAGGARGGRAALEVAGEVGAEINSAVQSLSAAAASAGVGSAPGMSPQLMDEASQQYRSSLSAVAAASAADGLIGRKRRREEGGAEELDLESPAPPPAQRGPGTGILASALGSAPAAAAEAEDGVVPGVGTDSKDEPMPPGSSAMGGGCPTCGSHGGSRKKRKSKAKKSRKHKRRASYRKSKHSKSHSPSEGIYASLPTPAATTSPHMESSGPPVRS